MVLKIEGLAKFKKAKRSFTVEEIQAALDSTEMKRFSVGVMHECKISKVDGKISDVDPDFLNVEFTLENADRETQRAFASLPLTHRVSMLTRSGKESRWVIGKSIKFFNCLGITVDQMVHLSDMVAMTEGAALEKLLGWQLKAMLKWPRHSAHAEYDSETQAYYLCDEGGQKLNMEPFQIPERKEGEGSKERFAEMVVAAEELGLKFAFNPEVHIFKHDTIVNPVTELFSSKNVKVAVEAVEEDDEDEEVAPPPPPKKALPSKKNTVTKTLPPPVTEDEDEESTEESFLTEFDNED